MTNLNTEALKKAIALLIKESRVGENREKDLSYPCAIAIASVIDFTVTKISNCLDKEFSDAPNRSTPEFEIDNTESRSEDPDSGRLSDSGSDETG